VLPVPDNYLDEARRSLEALIAEGCTDLPYPDESQALVQPASFCREMAKYILTTVVSGQLDEPDRSVRRAAYYLMAARLYRNRLNVATESIELVHRGSWEFATDV
jgi:hypothetical protein